jgi:glucosamine--fructose-6-phosphate aminotransferase (isomerizing)
MCGIVGIVGTEPVAGRLLDALKRLEYRGYDSAGIATIHEGVMDRRRAAGKICNLEHCLDASPLKGTTGMGHTRWATHGVPNETNAHPHFVGAISIVHNGIIENFSELRRDLVADGACFETQTDTEVVAHLMARYREEGLEPKAAMLKLVGRLKGAYALAIMLKDHPGTMMAARSGPPLAVGHGKGEMFFGSDAIALAPFTDKITYLDDGDCAVISRDGVAIFDRAGTPVDRPRQVAQAGVSLIDKGNHRHFMEKEISEQPEAISHVLDRYIDFASGTVRTGNSAIDFGDVAGLAISACGTAFLAGSIGRYWFEQYAGLPVEIDVASEFRYRQIPMSRKQAAFFISQSGETADTLASLNYCRQRGLKIGAIVNVTDSTIARAADTVFPILAGPEIGVASTKAFTCQLTVLACLAIAAGKARGTIDAFQERALVGHLAEIPRIMSAVLNDIQAQTFALARQLTGCKSVLYIGRGTSYPLAMEGALKLKEISYIHAEGYAAGELKHGPIALIDEHMPVIVIAPHDQFFDKTVSNMQEAAARGGRIILITDEAGAKASPIIPAAQIVLPNVDEIIAPMIFALPIQMLAYQTAVIMGTDVDQPRNLAKSVTVE